MAGEGFSLARGAFACTLEFIVNADFPFCWLQDLNRYASPVLRVAFDGPDLPEETLYRLLRVRCSSIVLKPAS